MIAKMLAKSLVFPRRQPLVKHPGDYGMDYHDVAFESPDGLTIRGWHIPAEGDRLIVVTHPMPFTR